MITHPNYFKFLAKDMESLARSGISASSHEQADGILIKALGALSTDETREAIQAIIWAYNKLEKWYS